MRTPLIAANWKMHPIPEGALQDHSPYWEQENVDVVVFPTFVHLQECIDARLVTGAQFGHSEDHGAHTGDVSMTMLKEIGCRYVLCGHSERRAHHNETNEDVAAQCIAALELGMHPVVCIGETEEERNAGREQEVVEEQLKMIPLHSDITLAYEPVWAIGTGNTATPEQAQDMHAFIRSLIPEEKRETTRILYGGSMKPENAAELLGQEDIDGGLVGGASLKPEAFGGIVEVARG